MINMRYFEASWVIVSIMALAMADLSLAQNSKQDYLDAHNEARAELGLRKLSWNDTVAAYAQSYADKRSADCELVHSEGPYGENLAMGSGELSAVDAVNLWVGEKKFYDHGSNTCLEGECGHYTQVVWKDTTQIGCARVECQNGWWFITCNYYPPGNYIGERPY